MLPVFLANADGWSRIDLVLHAIAFAFDNYGFGMMQKPVEDRGSDGAVIVEDFRPVLEGAVGGQQNGSALIAVADDLKQEIGAGFIERQIAKFINA